MPSDVYEADLAGQLTVKYGWNPSATTEVSSQDVVEIKNNFWAYLPLMIMVLVLVYSMFDHKTHSGFIYGFGLIGILLSATRPHLKLEKVEKS